MRSRKSISVLPLCVLSCVVCGCDFNPLKALQRLSDVDNSVVISDNVVTINIAGIPRPPNGNGGTNTTDGYNDGTFQVTTAQSTLPGDLHFRGTNHTSFLPPVAPSAGGFPF